MASHHAERLQFLVAFQRRNRVFRISVPIPILYLSVVVLVACMVGSGFLGQWFLNRLTNFGRLNRLTLENCRLKQDLATFAATVDSFRSFLVFAEEVDNKLRAVADLGMISSDMRLMGVGGNLPVLGAEAGIDSLLTRMAFAERSLVEVGRVLKDKEHELGHLPSIWPVQGWVNSGFGMRRDPFTRRRALHNGIDIVAPYGTAVVATADGVVVSAGWNSNWGRSVEIDHGSSIRTFYAHCRTVSVKAGERVTRGKTIATVGSSGRSTGVHLHYGVERNGRWVNPKDYILEARP